MKKNIFSIIFLFVFIGFPSSITNENYNLFKIYKINKNISNLEVNKTWFTNQKSINDNFIDIDTTTNSKLQKQQLLKNKDFYKKQEIIEIKLKKIFLQIINSSQFLWIKNMIIPKYKISIVDASSLSVRGETTSNKIKIINNIRTPEENIAVFLHEMGHSVDLSYSEKVKEFHEISFDKNDKIREGKRENFVSWYAMTNKYEDFAETYCFYILYNKEFEILSKNNKILQNKYNFIKNNIFKNQGFIWTSFSQNSKEIYKNNYWDATKLNINLDNLLDYVE